MRPLLDRLRDPANAGADEYQSLGDMCREAADEIERRRTAMRNISQRLYGLSTLLNVMIAEGHCVSRAACDAREIADAALSD